MNYGQRRNKRKAKLSFRRWMRKFYLIEGMRIAAAEESPKVARVLKQRILSGLEAQQFVSMDAMERKKPRKERKDE